ncbi:hypothetical protein B0181_00180 [Moraxella caviae]|uniref:Efflux transporter, RND family, MFP subunit n=1 Tax=Moraxella caviae TaxID=34060 RepID=A0A1T0ACV9_9GAMM|nr:hypothetical protein [Moraxella caviae]OOR93508.1 hypothetical protein B0181_00180 [Moraxella caviae]STZ10349.1 efflux transporter, RND family, MFP subunit [Moraxella caviae]VEW14206.1 efflux transporter, RND family, MFP subunit [Moraxella caviae]
MNFTTKVLNTVLRSVFGNAIKIRTAQARQNFARFGLALLASGALIACTSADTITGQATQEQTQKQEQNKTAHTKPADTQSPTIKDDTVILDKSQISSVKMTRYQPRIPLTGALIAGRQVALSLSDLTKLDLTKPTLSAWHKAVGEQVSKGDTLASITDAHGKTHALLAPFNGKVIATHITPDAPISTNAAFITLSDERSLEFVGRLPKFFHQHISIGDSVRFIANGEIAFGGQISHIDDSSDPLRVRAELRLNERERQTLKHTLENGALLDGQLEFGQMQVGVLLPDFAIFGADFSPLDLQNLTTPPFVANVPVAAHAWVITQDHRLKFAPIYVLEYQPNTQRFLVTGMTDDSLVVLTALPKHADGKLVQVP